MRALAVAALTLTLAGALAGCSQAEQTLQKAASAVPNAAAAACSSSVASASQSTSAAIPAGDATSATPQIQAALQTARALSADVETTFPQWHAQLDAAIAKVQASFDQFQATPTAGDPGLLAALAGLATACQPAPN